MRMPIRSRERFGSRRGNVMVEFALSATLLTSVFTGVFQYGYSMYMYNELVEAVRAGTRYASLANISNSGDGSIPTAFSTAVKNMVVYGTPSPGNSPTPVVPSLGTGQVAVNVVFDGGKVPQTVTVSINSYTIDAIVKTYTITGKPALTMPYFGQYCASGTTC
jgi:Flp pilus assembly protein TadG